MKTIKQHPWLFCLLLFFIFGSIVLVLLPPLFLEQIVNRLADKQTVPLLLAVAYFAAFALSGVFDAGREILITMFGQKLTCQVRREMCEKLRRLPASYFTKTEPGVTTSRFVSDVDTLEALFSSGIIGMFVDACKVIGILAIIFSKSKGLFCLLLVIAPFLFVFTRFVQKRMLIAQKKNREAVGRLNGFVPETVRNIRSIHVFSKENRMEKKYNRLVLDSYKAVDRVNFFDAVYSPVILIVSACLVAVMMCLAASGGALQSLFGMSVGTAVAVIAYVGKVFGPLESIGMEIQTVQSAVAGVCRIREFLSESEREPFDEKAGKRVLSEKPEEVIRVENVSFSYEDQTEVLKGLSFQVKRGEKVTLSGRTGAGKSTLFKLLLGYYLPKEGSVSVNGEQCGSIPDSCKRKLFGYVEQNFRPVPGTVEDQIRVFDESITFEDVENAAKLCGIHATVLHLKQGYKTPYEDSLFSMGQKQLLSVARAVAANPEILLLDEITANLDTETEERVLNALEKASEQRTVVSISHRLYERSGGRIIEI